MILMDTRPLVSLFDPRYQDHKLCQKILKGIVAPLYTTEADITKVLHILNPGSKGTDGIRHFILQDYLNLLSLNKEDIRRGFTLMDKFKDLPMDFADATLVTIAENLKTQRIFTLDLNNFKIYRMKKGYRNYPFEIVGLEILEHKSR